MSLDPLGPDAAHVVVRVDYLSTLFFRNNPALHNTGHAASLTTSSSQCQCICCCTHSHLVHVGAYRLAWRFVSQVVSQFREWCDRVTCRLSCSRLGSSFDVSGYLLFYKFGACHCTSVTLNRQMLDCGTCLYQHPMTLSVLAIHTHVCHVSMHMFAQVRL